MASAKSMAAYLTEQQLPPGAVALASYYGQVSDLAAPTARADMAPEVAAALGLTPGAQLDEKELTFILAGRRADGEALAVQAQHREATSYGEERGEDKADSDGPVRHRVAYVDLCFQAPKSLSVAWAFAETEAERNSLLQAHRTARDEALRYVEEQIVRARLGDGGKDGYERARVAWISVDHFTARPTLETTSTDPATGEVFTELHNLRVAGDPHLHSHNVMPVTVVTESGRVATLDTRAFHGRVHEAGAIYQALLARELRVMGVAVELDERTHMAALPAIPEHVCETFSRRTRDGDAAARTLAAKEGRDWDSMTSDQRVAFAKYGTHATRLDKETNTPDQDAWKAQAVALGWDHRSVVAYGPPASTRTYAERMEAASQVALPHLAEMLSKRAVISQGDIRLAAARGFIAAGLETTADMGAMMKHWAQSAVQQDGRWTKLIWREAEGGRVKLTTELHRDQEDQLVHLARAAAASRSHTLAPGEIAAAVGKSGLTFSGEHGAAQRAAIETFGTDGDLSVLIGVAGAGKTAMMAPLVGAWRERGYEVWGTALSNRQATALGDAGIERIHTRAVQPLLDSLRDGRAALGADSVVVLDEIGQIGTRQLLDLLRHREQHGFKLVAIGDDKQCAAIDAGPVVDLLRRALGEERVPQLLSTIRQHSEEERRVATLFRDGKAGEAIAAKREDGTAELAPGGYRDAVQRVAALYAERRQATRDRPGYTITISAPTNMDAREIAREVREQRRGFGEVGPDRVTMPATDGRGAGYSLTLAEGDTVRLFRRTRAVFTGGDGKQRSSIIGDNGSVLRVEAVLPDEGLRLRSDSGKVGFVAWSALRDTGSGRVLLAHGDCLTIDSSQGVTSDEHINALPAGSRAVPGGKAYVAASRHRVRSYLVGSQGAELREVQERRPSGLGALTPEQGAHEAWANVVRNFQRETLKESALAFLERAIVAKRATVKVLQSVLRTHERREADGEDATTVRETLQVQAIREALPRIAEGLGEVASQQAAVAAGVGAMAAYWADREARRIEVAARLVSEGDLPLGEALARIIAADLGDQRRGLPVNPVHGTRRLAEGVEEVEQVEQRVERRLLAAVDAYEARQEPVARPSERQGARMRA